MNRVSHQSLGRELAVWMAALGVDMAEVLQQCRALAVFGSRSLGLHRQDSDWDLFVLDGGGLENVDGCDVVSLRSENLNGWVGTEICQHIAHFGVFLKGDGAALGGPYQPRARLAKERLIVRRMTAVSRASEFLDDGRFDRQMVLVRRHIQRLDLIAIGEPVPPAAVLDASWLATGSRGILTPAAAIYMERLDRMRAWACSCRKGE